MNFPHTAIMHTSIGDHTLNLAVANNLWRRFHGLMLHSPLDTDPIPQGLLLTRCPSIHTAFMRYSIDVVYLSGAQSHQQNIDSQTTTNLPQAQQTYSDQKTYTVTYLKPNLKPWRASIAKRKSIHALELPAGSISRLGIVCGDTLTLVTH